MTINEACTIFNISYTKTINDKDLVKLRYKELAIQHHPDTGGSDEQFKQLQDAYELLKVYVFEEKVQKERKHSIVAKKRKKRGYRPLDPRDAIININVSIRELYKGFDQIVMYNVRSICQYCSGRACAICNGALSTIEINAEVYIHSTLMTNDLEIIYEGLGDRMHENGDLVLKILINDDEFEIDDLSIVSKVKINKDQLALTVNTLDGLVNIDLINKDLSKPLRLKNKGLEYKTNDGNIVRGDHLIKLLL